MRTIPALTAFFIGLLVAALGLAQVTVETAPPGQTLPWGSTVVVSLDESWKDVRRSAQPRSDTEPALAKFSDRASREGSILRLRLEGDRVLKIFDEGVCDGFATCLHHRLRDWWPRLHYYVVEFTHGENGWAYLIRESDGLVVRVADTPILSPDNRYAIASNPTLDGKTELLDMRPDPPTIHPVAWPSMCPEHVGLIMLGNNIVWADNSQIVFNDAQFISKDEARPVRLTLQIVDGQPRWQC